MEKKLKKLSKRVNFYLSSYLSKFNSSELTAPMKYGLFPGGKKIRSKIIFDVGNIFGPGTTVAQCSCFIKRIPSMTFVTFSLPFTDSVTALGANILDFIFGHFNSLNLQFTLIITNQSGRMSQILTKKRSR